VASFLLHNRHAESECAATFAAWRGFDSPLRASSPIASCLAGGHELWWLVEADDTDHALGHLPAFVAERTRAVRIARTPLP
jgi:hypothetical protein